MIVKLPRAAVVRGVCHLEGPGGYGIIPKFIHFIARILGGASRLIDSAHNPAMYL